MGQWWANCGPWANSDLLPGFENMVLLEYGYNHSFQLHVPQVISLLQCDLKMCLWRKKWTDEHMVNRKYNPKHL